MDLVKAAKWFDEEYNRLSTWRGKLEGHAAKRLEGELGAFAETAALLRQMARTDDEPQHIKPWHPTNRDPKHIRDNPQLWKPEPPWEATLGVHEKS